MYITGEWVNLEHGAILDCTFVLHKCLREGILRNNIIYCDYVKVLARHHAAAAAAGGKGEKVQVVRVTAQCTDRSWYFAAIRVAR
jgi:hypothetical protein